jgi:hypothetical protein
LAPHFPRGQPVVKVPAVALLMFSADDGGEGSHPPRRHPRARAVDRGCAGNRGNGIANLDPAVALFVQQNADRFSGRYRRWLGGWSSDGRFFQCPRFPHLDIRAVGGGRITGANGDDFFLGPGTQVGGEVLLQRVVQIREQPRMRVAPLLFEEGIHSREWVLLSHGRRLSP